MHAGNIFLIRRDKTDACYLVGTVQGQEHRLGRQNMRITRPHDNLSPADTADKKHAPRAYAVLPGEGVNATRNDVAVFQAKNENPTQTAFGCLHALPLGWRQLFDQELTLKFDNPVPQQRCPLEFQTFCEFLHLLFQIVHHAGNLDA